MSKGYSPSQRKRAIRHDKLLSEVLTYSWPRQVPEAYNWNLKWLLGGGIRPSKEPLGWLVFMG